MNHRQLYQCSLREKSFQAQRLASESGKSGGATGAKRHLSEPFPLFSFPFQGELCIFSRIFCGAWLYFSQALWGLGAKPEMIFLVGHATNYKETNDSH